jgi:hypothetical protein
MNVVGTGFKMLRKEDLHDMHMSAGIVRAMKSRTL